MRFERAVFEAACGAAARVLPLREPADAVLSRFFREHRQLGQGDRATVADTAYALLRRRRLFTHVWPDASLREGVLFAWGVLLGANLRELDAFARPAEARRLAAAKAAALGPQPFEVECDLPDWVLERLLAEHAREQVLNMAKGLLAPALLDLRVNTLKLTREEAIERLSAAGFTVKPTPFSPLGIRVTGKPAVNRHELFEQGAIEVQDEGSQLLALITAPRRGEMVADFCAGAGGKTLALGALMRSSGRLYAFDVSENRLARFKPRLARSGLSNVHPQRIADERDARIGRLAGKLDRVLVDAPCSGLGTLRRNPDLKWRQTPESVVEMRSRQAAILASAARLIKPGGRLVYATCSLLREENRDVVDGFLAAHPQFRRGSAGAALAEARVPLDMGEDLELLPHVHGTDGFYAAVLERSA